MVKTENDVSQSQEPDIRGVTTTIHDPISVSFHRLPSIFSIVLVLILGFTLPERTMDVTQVPSVLVETNLFF